MLRLIKGAAGTGKSSFIRREIAKLCEGNEANVILLVPEQFSFETEREFYELLGAERAGKVKVLSFMRLCDDVFRQYGGMAGDYACLLYTSLSCGVRPHRGGFGQCKSFGQRICGKSEIME